VHRNYQAGEWVPHVSVATRAQGAKLATVVRSIADVLPLSVRVDRAALVDSSTGRTWQLPHIV
jgi:2'-5' RNA ligase